MSNNFLKFVKKAVVGMALLCLTGWSNAASINVTPSVISNTYAGVITLNITGLTNSEQVQIRKYLDVNANGTVDPGEPVVEGFKISDGGAFVEGGITNINVPFDSNSNTDAITTTLNFTPPWPLENMVGQYIFTLSSPSGRFSPKHAIFTVTNAVLSQSISGIVYSNGVAPVPYAVVVVLNYPSTTYAGGVVADGAGYYHLNLNPGAYQIMPGFPGYVADGSLAPQVTLTNGMAATNDLFLTNGTVTISGSVSDASGNALSGVMIELKSGSLNAMAFTDTNGNYSAAVTPAIWNVDVDSDHMAQRAYVVSKNSVQADTTGGSVTNVNLTLYKANALFYGSITNTSGAPFANISFSANDGLNQFQAKSFSDANGDYCVAVFGGTNLWYCSPDTSSPPLSSCIVSSASSTNLASGQALLQNFTVMPVSAQISGHLQDSFSNALAGVGINADTTINGIQFHTYADTDVNGDYSLPAAAGTWNVNVNCCGNDGLSSKYGLVDTNSHVVTIPPTNTVLNITAYPPGLPLTAPAYNSDGSFQFGFLSAPDITYTIQYSSNLTTWISVLSFQSPGGPMLIVDPNAAGSSQRFYRVKIGP